MMMMMSANAAVNGLGNNRLQRKATKSSMPTSRKRLDPSHKNISRLRDRTVRVLPHEAHYKPKVSEGFLEEWLDFPVDNKSFIPWSMVKMFGTWLLWNTKSMAGLDPNDLSIRDRVTNQVSVLGTAAGLFLVVAIAGLLVPPITNLESDKIWVDIYGCIMFTASTSLIFYICLALTAFYPLIMNLRDDVAFDAYETYQRRVGGYETYLFYVGLQLVAVAILVAAKIIYSTHAAIIMLIIFLIFVGFATTLAREIFVSLDPISAMHMGLTNDPEVQYRAELLSHFMLRKIPNSIVDDEDHPDNDLFARKRESVKYEETRASVKLMTASSPTSLGATTIGTTYSKENQLEGGELCENAKPFAMHNIGGGASNFEPEELEVENIETGASFQANNTTKSSHRRAYAAVHPEDVSSAEETSLFVSSSSQRTPPTDPRQRDLRELFCGDAYLFQSYGLSRTDSTSAYDQIVWSGCGSSEELLQFLDDNKQARLQGVCNCTAPDRDHGAHDVECGSRVAAMWTDGLTNIKIPVFHAVKIVRALKKDLK